jgi:mono/diheme cytochrome c family protein
VEVELDERAERGSDSSKVTGRGDGWTCGGGSGLGVWWRWIMRKRNGIGTAAMLGVLWLAIWVVWGYGFAVSGWSTVVDRVAAPAGVVTAPNAGEEMYAAYCVGCHGEDGLGYGRYSSGCTVPPSDLTQLARKNHGIYPAEKVRTVLRQGTGQAPAGRGYMPIWEPLLKVLNGDGPGVTEVRIRSLAEYVRTLQDRSMVAGK